jgi:hypothetical protein
MYERRGFTDLPEAAGLKGLEKQQLVESGAS